MDPRPGFILRRQARMAGGRGRDTSHRVPSASQAAAFVLMVLLASACGGASGSSGNVGKAAASSREATTVVTVTTLPPAPDSTAPSASLSVFAGKYAGSTGSSGNADIKDDGSGRFDAPDLSACASCSNASAPRATIDFKFTSAVPTGSGRYQGTGVITAESNPAQAAAVGAGAVGVSIEASLSAAGGLTLSFLRPEIVLLRTGGAASAPEPATAARTDTGPDAFLSPSRNIGCRIDATSARCDVKE